jgi:hypothetical protein
MTTRVAELEALEPATFQHLVNSLALRVLGAGHASFGPGPDGGRDGFFRGRAPYPSNVDCWSGVWYLQAKHRGHSTASQPQPWLLQQIKRELEDFSDDRRRKPDIWILATNIEPSARTYDRAAALVKDAGLCRHFDIWGGRKLLDFLSRYPEVRRHYAHLLTPGDVLQRLFDSIEDKTASDALVVRCLLSDELETHKYTRIEEAGMATGTRPPIHDVYVDLPFSHEEHSSEQSALAVLTAASAENHRQSDHHLTQDEAWKHWATHPTRAPVWVVKGGPGQGKSTLVQYYEQIQRAALVLAADLRLSIDPETRLVALQIRERAQNANLWTVSPRIPLHVALKDYAAWYATQNSAKGILTFVGDLLRRLAQEPVTVPQVRRLLAEYRWAVAFDGLDEVPGDIKDDVAFEVLRFIREARAIGDVLAICTTRPQGYSGQFDRSAGAAIVNLSPLPKEVALACAERIVRREHSETDANRCMKILSSAVDSSPVATLMTTPLQAHMMALLVRGGRRPPYRKWDLYQQYYELVRQREAARALPDSRLSDVLRNETALLREVHARLGFVLHSLEERGDSAASGISWSDFRKLVADVVAESKDADVLDLTDTLVKATEERLVVIIRPAHSERVSFGVRQLQEFFAGEFIYRGVRLDELRRRLQVIAGDVHWNEVTYFVLSAVIESNRRNELDVVVGVLEALDNRPGEIDGNIARRAFRGASLAAKLLRDGVLEQDKRLRNRFAFLIGSLAGANAELALEAVGMLTHADSRRWLVQLLIALASGQEMLAGTVALLLVNLTEQDSETSTFIDLLRSLSCPSRAPYAALKMLTEEGRLRRWHLEAIRHCSNTGSALASLSHHQLWGTINSSERSLLLLYRMYDKDEIAQHDYGWVRLSYGIPLPDVEAAQTEILSTLEHRDVGPLFEPAYRALVLKRRPTKTAFLALLDCLGGRLSFIPSRLPELQWLESAKSLTALRQEIDSLAECEFELWLRTKSAGTDSEDDAPETVHFAPTEPSRENFIALLEQQPHIALEIVLMRHSDPYAPCCEVLENPIVRDRVLEACSNTPDLLTDINALDWPSLGKYFGDNDSLKRLLLRTQQAVEESAIGHYSPAVSKETHQFQIDLENERSLLLPFCIGFIANFADSALEDCHASYANELLRFIPKASALRTVIDDPLATDADQLSAALLLMLHQEGGFDQWRRYAHLFRTKAALERGFVFGVITAAALVDRQYEREVVELVDLTIDRNRDVRDAFLSLMRQTGAAPVTTSGGPQSWLRSAD